MFRERISDLTIRNTKSQIVRGEHPIVSPGLHNKYDFYIGQRVIHSEIYLMLKKKSASRSRVPVMRRPVKRRPVKREVTVYININCKQNIFRPIFYVFS